MDLHSVSPMPEKAPMAEFDKSPPTPPDEESAPVDLPPPPPVAVNVDPLAPTDEKSRMDGEGWGCGNWLEYVVMIFAAIVLLLASTVIVLFWVIQYRSGFAWNDNPQKQFNLHPVLMIAGFITLSGFSMLLYRLARSSSRIYVKLLHTIFHAMAIPCVVVGFLAVLDSHNLANPPIPNFYSLHSWLGFVTMGLFAIQFIVGFFSFLVLLCCESSTAGCRASLVPFHAAFGFLTFMLAVATCLTGLTEKAIFTLGDNYQKLTEESYIINGLAMTLVATLIIMTYVLRRRAFHPKRCGIL